MAALVVVFGDDPTSGTGLALVVLGVAVCVIVEVGLGVSDVASAVVGSGAVVVPSTVTLEAIGALVAAGSDARRSVANDVAVPRQVVPSSGGAGGA